MTTIVPRYETYKDSGETWLGKVPTSWKVVRNKEIFEERNLRSNTGEETLLTVSHITGVTPRSEKNVNMFMAETMEGYKLCRKGDLIINTMWAWMGALGTTRYEGICSPSYNVYKPHKNVPYDARYFDYLYRTPNSVVEMTRNSKGIVSSRLRLYAKDFFQIQTALPSLYEQNAIADYLDAKTAQIDRNIELLTQKANLYGQLKQSIIYETVTKGLDKTVAMQNSGVEWLGEVPANWETRRIKDFSIIINGSTPKSNVEEYWEGEYTWITTDDLGKLSSKFITESKRTITKLGFNSCGTTLCPAGSIVLSSRAPIGHIGILNIPACTNQGCKTLKINLRVINSVYLFYSILSSKNKLQALGRGTTFTELSTKELSMFFIPTPSLSEQNAIADYLDTKTAQIDRIVDTIQTQIEKLQELRKTLINDLVTGKIKVVDL